MKNSLSSQKAPRLNRIVAKSLQNFTLIELLVVIMIIAILASLLLPALNSAREKGLSVHCLSNQKSLGMAVAQYMHDFQDWVPFVQESFDNHPPYEWKVLLDPYIQKRVSGYPQSCRMQRLSHHLLIMLYSERENTMYVIIRESVDGVPSILSEFDKP